MSRESETDVESETDGLSARQAPVVLLVNEYGVLNGGENSLLAVIRTLAKSYTFEALVPADSELELALHHIGISNHGLTLRSSGARLPQSTLREKLGMQIAEIRPSLVHCNSLAMGRLLGPVLSKLGIAGVGYLRDILKLSKTAIRDLNCVDQLVAVSNATRDYHVAQGIESRRVEVIYNGVDGDDLKRRSGARQCSRDTTAALDSGPVILFVGQLGARKGIDVLIHVFERIVAQAENAQLWIVGERNSDKQEARDLEARLRVQVLESSYCDKAQWLGRRNDIASLMQQSTILLHPARQEPLGRVLLEAASLGTPIVSTHVGGTPEILSTPIASRMMCEVDNVEQLANCCLELISDTTIYTQYRNELRQVAENFSVKACAERLSSIYTKLLD